MIRVLVIYNTEDFKKWKRVYESNTGDRKAHGSKEAYIYRNLENPNELEVMYIWNNVENAREYFNEDNFKNKMFAAGVVGEPEIRYLEEMDRSIG